MGNDETRSALHQLVKRLLNLQFGTGIDAGGRLVEDQHRRQAEHDTGDTKKLFLPLADAVFAENRVKPLRQTLDKLPAVCLFGRIDDLLFRRIRLSEADVVAHGSLFDPGILQHHTKAAAERMAGQFVDRLSVDADLSGIDIIEAHQQVDKRRLSASGRADNGNTHARLYVKIKVLDQFFLFVITKCYIIDRHISRHGIDRSGRVCTLLFLFQKSKDTACAGKRVLHLGDNGTDIIERFHILVCVRQQNGKSADSQRTARDHESSHKGNTGIDHVVDKTGGRVR